VLTAQRKARPRWWPGFLAKLAGTETQDPPYGEDHLPNFLRFKEDS
jgi:hypothetical protein